MPGTQDAKRKTLAFSTSNVKNRFFAWDALNDALVHVDGVADGEVWEVVFRLQLVGDDGFKDLSLVEFHTKQLHAGNKPNEYSQSRKAPVRGDLSVGSAGIA